MVAVAALLTGLLVVIGGIVVLRQHAFVSLLAAGLVVGLFTTSNSTLRSLLRADSLTVASIESDGLVVQGKVTERKPGGYAIFRVRPDRTWERHGELEIASVTGDKVALSQPPKSLHRGDQLVALNKLPEAAKTSEQSLVTRLVSGFGETCRKVGILIAMAAIVGACLLESGAAWKIVQTIGSWCGEKRTPVALATSGFVLGIPVFFDTVFFLLIPLAKALYRKTGKHYLLYVLSIVVGGTMAHSLVPPTPGPLFVAEELGVNLGTTILVGLVIGIGSAIVGYGYAWLLDRREEVIPDLDADEEQQASASESDIDEIHSGATETNSLEKAPSFFFSLLPILIPICLLGTAAIIKFVGADSGETWVKTLVSWIGDKNIALSLAAAVGLVMLYRTQRGAKEAQHSIQVALAAGGTVILITAAGGALGQMIRQTDIAGQLSAWFPESTVGIGLLVMAFTMTALVRVAQGSATVAMITAVGLVAPIISTVELPFHPVYLVMAVGCGSKPLPWMNDSGFWVVGKMSGLTPGQTFRGFSIMLTVMGFAGLLLTIAMASILPLV